MASQDIVIGTKVDLSGLKQGEKKVTESVDSMSSSFSGKGTNAVKSFGASLTSTTAIAGVATTAIVAMGTALIGITKATAEFIADQSIVAREMQRISVNSDIAIGSINSLSRAFVNVGGEIDNAGDFVQDFVERIGDAKSGSGSLQESFDSLGVELTGTNEQILKDTIKSLGEMEDQSVALFRGIELFGDSYKLLATDIAKGNDVFGDSVLLSEEFIVNSAKMKAITTEMSTEFKFLASESLAPLVDSMGDFIFHISQEGIFEAFISYMQDVATVADFVTEAFNKWAGIAEESTLEEQLQRSIDLDTESIRILTEMMDEGVFAGQRLIDAQRQLAEAETRLAENKSKLSTEQIRLNSTYQITTRVIEEQTEAIEIETRALEEFSYQWSFLTGIQIDDTNEKIEAMNRLRKATAESNGDIDKAINGSLDTKPDFEQAKMDFAQQSFQFTEDLADIAMNNSINREQRKIDALKKSQSEELSGFIGSNRRRQQIEAKNAKEIEEREKALAKKRGKMQMAQAGADLASGLLGIWSQDLGKMGTFGIPFAIGTSAMLTGIAGAQMADIASSMQGFATGGIVGGGGVAPSQGADNTVATLRDTEMVLNAEQQTQLFEMANGAGGGGINIVINGNVTQDHLSELEDNIRALQNNGRTNFEVVS